MSVIDARTLAVLARVDAAADGSYTARVAPSQQVRVLVEYTLHSCPDSVLSRETVVRGATTVDLTLAETCGV